MGEKIHGAPHELGRLTGVVITVSAVLSAALFAAVMAFPLFRLKGLYFAIGTLVLSFILQVLALNLTPLTGGSYGIYVPPRFFVSAATTRAEARGGARASVAGGLE